MTARIEESAKGYALINHLNQFVSQLKYKGIAIDASRFINFSEATTLVGLSKREDFKQAARLTLIASKDDYRAFEQVFENYWRKRTPLPPLSDGDGDEGAAEASAANPSDYLSEPAANNNDNLRQTDSNAYSQLETLRRKDVAQLTAEEFIAAQQEMARLAKLLAHDYGRRKAPSRKGDSINFRKWLRLNSLRPNHVSIPYRQAVRNKSRLFVLCDVSGSMDRYSRFFLYLLYAMNRSFKRTSIALFSTRTIDVSEDFRRGTMESSLKELSEHVTEWSGGTKIGRSLATFLDFYAHRMNAGNSVSLIISDGWDTGENKTLKKAMINLKQRSQQVIWLNPLLGDEGYQPLCQGMHTALPYIDQFLPAHNIESLRDALKKLSVLL